MGRSGLRWVAAGCTGLYWVAVGRAGLQWVAVGCSGLHWVALGCTGLYWVALGRGGLHWVALGCTGSHWFAAVRIAGYGRQATGVHARACMPGKAVEVQTAFGPQSSGVLGLPIQPKQVGREMVDEMSGGWRAGS